MTEQPRMIEQQSTIEISAADVRAVVSGLVGRALSAADDQTALADLEPDRYDSLGVLDCVAAIEQRFGVDIDLVDDDLRVTFRSVASITDLVRRRLADQGALEWTA
jgi:acyl carrier protein